MNFNKRKKTGKDTSWNKSASWYDSLVGEKGSDYHQNVIIPNALKLLKPQKNEKIIDIGCGQGVFCRELHTLGIKVLGIDASKNLIDAAKKRSPEIKYLVASAQNLNMFENKSFDAATSIMAMQNMDLLFEVIHEMSRVIKVNGRALIVISHPAFRIPRQSGWGFDETRKIQYRRVDMYLSEKKIPIQMNPGYDQSKITWTFHRPISTYINALGQNNMAIVRMEEWTTHRRTNEKVDNRSRDEFPLFLAILARKI
ncbi:class I SAM-dependent methyltransferase [Candidatus Saganbacteria bacterium]|nr:class I SAM-dependent methyltransferase [Candidatus Saganbacteria bacterium]